MKATTAFLTLVFFLPVFDMGLYASSENKPSEIELMKLDFEIACEKSDSCKDKIAKGDGTVSLEQFEIKKYKTGDKMSKFVNEKKKKEEAN